MKLGPHYKPRPISKFVTMMISQRGECFGIEECFKHIRTKGHTKEGIPIRESYWLPRFNSVRCLSNKATTLFFPIE